MLALKTYGAPRLRGLRLRGLRLTVATLASVLALSAAAGTASMAATAKYRSVADALDQGLGAVNSGYPEMAEPALQYVIKNGGEDAALLGRYYLARIYADNNGARTAHGRAYELYKQIADDYADIDPDDDRRTLFVSKSLIAVAGYLRRGLTEIGLEPNARRAAEYLRHAATMFGDEDAQFELAKMQLKGEGVDREPALAKHWLATLSQKGHVGAQAFLADLYWRGKDIEKDHARALALIQIAVANASPGERVWIQDIYQNIFCGTAEGVRKQATGLVADWRNRLTRKPVERSRDGGLGSLGADAVRTCNDGTPVAPVINAHVEQKPSPGTRAPAAASALPSPVLPVAPVAETATQPAAPPAFAHGSASAGLGLTGGVAGGVGSSYAPASGR